MKSNWINCVDGDYEYKMNYTQWGDLNNPNVLICVHGLTRNCRDFDYLAKVLSKDYLVICPDVVGRGKSDRLSRPENYDFPLYCWNLLILINKLNLTNINWLGTSLGGIIGMMMASWENSPIKKLILNDVGAWIAKEEIQKIADYLALENPRFSTFNEGLVYLKKVHQQFGNLTAEMWEHLAKYSLNLTVKGDYILHYDPNIALIFKQEEQIKDVNLWIFWEKITCPVLLLHGEESRILTTETMEKMQEIKPNMQVINWSNCGHAPSLMIPEQIEIIKSWLITI